MRKLFTDEISWALHECEKKKFSCWVVGAKKTSNDEAKNKRFRLVVNGRRMKSFYCSLIEKIIAKCFRCVRADGATSNGSLACNFEKAFERALLNEKWMWKLFEISRRGEIHKSSSLNTSPMEEIPTLREDLRSNFT